MQCFDSCGTLRTVLSTPFHRLFSLLRVDPQQVLEQEKREVQQLPVEMMDLWDARRHRAAARIQAVWRGRLQRRKVGLALPSQRAPLSAGDAFATQLRKFKAESAPYMAELDGNNATDFVQRVTADAAVDVATGPDAGRIGHRRRQELLDYVESQMEVCAAAGGGAAAGDASVRWSEEAPSAVATARQPS